MNLKSLPYTLITACTIVSILGLAGCSQKQTSQAAPTSAISQETTATEVSETQTLTGVVDDGTMNTLTVKTADGSLYMFDKSQAEVTTGTTGIVIGNPVSITYCGELNPDEVSQTVEVTKILVEDPES